MTHEFPTQRKKLKLLSFFRRHTSSGRRWWEREIFDGKVTSRSLNCGDIATNTSAYMDRPSMQLNTNRRSRAPIDLQTKRKKSANPSSYSLFNRSILMNVQRELLVQSYRLRVKAERDLTLAKRSLHSRSNHLLVYFKGEQGLTQTLMLPLSQIKDGVYENFFELLNVGNVKSTRSLSDLVHLSRFNN